jgi:hypothetical protein
MERMYDRQGHSHNRILAHAVGFSAGDCDILTTYTAVEAYEVRQGWGIEQKIEVSMGGEVREGRLRPVGVYPMGLDLACIDLDPQASNGKTWMMSPLALEGVTSGDFVIGDDFFNAVPGTPFLDEKGKVAFMFVTNDGSFPEFIPAAKIRLFLNEAGKVPRA